MIIMDNKRYKLFNFSPIDEMKLTKFVGFFFGNMDF